MNKTNENNPFGMKMIEVNQTRFAVEMVDGNVRVNLTQMAKPFGYAKRPANWLRTTEAESYLEALSVAQKRVTTDLVEVRQGGRNQGTWAYDYRIAMRFAQWLDPFFSIQVDDLLVKLLTGEKLVVQPFNGVWPTIIDGKPMYNHCGVLKSLGMSTRSGSVTRRKRIYPKQFVKFMNQNYISLELCNLLRRKSEVKQLELDFELKYGKLNPKGGA